MEYIANLGDIKVIADIVKLYCIIIGTYYLNIKITNSSEEKKIIKKVIILVILFVVCMLIKYIKEILGYGYSIISLIILIGLFYSYMMKKKISYSIIISFISLSINYVLFIASTIITFFIFFIINTQSDYINIIIILTIYILLLYRFKKIKRFKKGIIFLQNKLQDEYFNILLLNISSEILFILIILSNYNRENAETVGTAFIFFSIMLFITIQKSLQLYYKQKQLIKNLDETKKELEEKKKEIQELEEENLKFSEKSHSISHQQKSLAHKIEKLELKNEIGEESGIKERLNDISKKLEQKEAVKLSETGVTQVDDMLDYMQSECIKNKIDFQLQLNGNIHHMTNKYLGKEELEILLADHIKNAIIAIQYLKETNNKSILVRLGKIDGNYAIYFYDTGIEFNIETLFNLGKKPSTTHKDNGGTGIGFMNTFNTLRKRNASLIVKEYGKPCDSNFTKVLMIIFDGKQEYKICSYRWEEIQKKNVDKDIKIEKI